MKYFGNKQRVVTDEDTAAAERLMAIASRYRPDPAAETGDEPTVQQDPEPGEPEMLQ